jgi:hypothetical protein
MSDLFRNTGPMDWKTTEFIYKMIRKFESGDESVTGPQKEYIDNVYNFIDRNFIKKRIPV